MKNSQAGWIGKAVLLIIVICITAAIWGTYYLQPHPHSYSNPDLAKTYPALSSMSDETFRKDHSDGIIMGKEMTFKVLGTSITLNQVNQNIYTCNQVTVKPQIYSSFNSGGTGGWGSTSVVDCGSSYFILEAYDSPTGVFGPFQK